MSLIVSGSKKFDPAPEGLWDAVCVDVVDIGDVTSTYQGKSIVQHKCRVFWELSCKMADGRPFVIMNQYTVSLSEKATLYKHLKSWRGRPFTQEELEGFDLENVIGAPCRIVVVHTENEGNVYGNITSIMKADPNTKLSPSGRYVRMKDRPPKDSAAAMGNERDASNVKEDEVPF